MGGSASQGTDGQKPAYLMPQGLSAVILAISLFFAITSLGVVSLRIWIRGRANILGWDDYFMAVGLALFLVAAGMASYDTFQGLGTPTKLIDDDMEIVGLKVNILLLSLTLWPRADPAAVCMDMAALLHGVPRLHQEQHLYHIAAHRHPTCAPMGALYHSRTLYSCRSCRIYWHAVRVPSDPGTMGRRW